MKEKKRKYPNPRWNRKEITVAELREFLVGKRIRLECGHHFCVHPLSKILVLTAKGHGLCAECWE